MTDSQAETDAILRRLAKHSRAGAVMTLVGALVLAVALGYSATTLPKLEARKKALQKDIAQLDKKLITADTALKNARLTIERAQGIEAACADLRRTVATGGNVTKAEQVQLTRASHATYLIGVFGSGVPPQEVVNIGNALKADGYTIKFLNAMPGERPSWFAPEPTVLYYSQKTSQQANDISARLTELTGKRFTVRKGAGYDVPRDQVDWLLYVHDVAISRALPNPALNNPPNIATVPIKADQDSSGREPSSLSSTPTPEPSAPPTPEAPRPAVTGAKIFLYTTGDDKDKDASVSVSINMGATEVFKWQEQPGERWKGGSRKDITLDRVGELPLSDLATATLKICMLRERPHGWQFYYTGQLFVGNKAVLSLSRTEKTIEHRPDKTCVESPLR